MSNTVLTRFVLPAAVLLPLCLGAGYLGAALHGPPPESTGESADRDSVGPDVKGFLAEVQRRLEVQNDRIDQMDRSVTSFGNQLQEVLTRVDKIERRPAAVAPVEDVPAKAADTPLSPTELEVRESLHEQFAKRIVATQRARLEFLFKTISDSSSKGKQDRDANAYVEANAAFKHFGADDKESREIYLEYYRRLANEVGPLVGSGMEGSDMDSVRPRFLEILDDRNAKIAKLLEGENQERWTKEQDKLRKIVADVLTK